MIDQLITPEQLAERLQCNVETIYRKREEFPHYRIGRQFRFDWEEVLDYLKEGEHE